MENSEDSKTESTIEVQPAIKSGAKSQIKKTDSAIKRDPNIVKFQCKYKEGYSNKRPLKEGVHEIDKTMALRLQKKGAGKILN